MVLSQGVPWAYLATSIDPFKALFNFFLVSYFLKIYFIIYFWLYWVFAAVCELSPITASRGYSLLVVCRLLTTLASLVAEHGF